MFSCSELKHLFTYSPIHFSPVCLEIKRKTENILLLRVKTTVHLFTYSPFPFILPFVNFRLVEPKRRCSHHILQNWAYATIRRLASLLLQFLAWLIQRNYAIWRVWKSNEKWPAFFWSELKQLFTYSPIHFLEIKSKSGQPFLAPS